MRAYGGAARDCLRAATRITKRPRTSFHINLPYKALGSLYQLLPRLGAAVAGDKEYREDGSVSVIVMVDSEKSSEFRTLVSDLTSGEVVPKIV